MITTPADSADPIRGEMRAVPSSGFGRLVLNFPEPVSATVRVAGGVLVLSFDRPINIPVERLNIILPNYIAAARLDPDRRSVRAALIVAVKADLKDAAEELYLDLIPQTWRGAPPPLPADVVAKLAARVRAARVPEARASAPPSSSAIGAVGLAVARTERQTRLTFILPFGSDARAEQENGKLTVRIEGPALLDPVMVKAQLHSLFEDAALSADKRTLTLSMPGGTELATGREENAFSVDLVSSAAKSGKPVPSPQDAPQSAESPAQPGTTKRDKDDGSRRIAIHLPPPSAQSGFTPDDQPVFSFDKFNKERMGNTRERERELLFAAANASKRDRTSSRLELARFYLSNKYAEEALGVLTVLAQEDLRISKSREVLLLRGLANVMRDNQKEARQDLTEPALELDGEAALLRATVASRAGHSEEAYQSFKSLEQGMDGMPEVLQGIIRPAAVSAALARGDMDFARLQLTALEKLDSLDRPEGMVQVLAGRTAESLGQISEALRQYTAAIAVGGRPYEAEARLQKSQIEMHEKTISPAIARAELETVAIIWRRGPVEMQAQSALAKIAASEGRWRDAFMAMHRTLEIQPEHPVARALQDEMGLKFEGLFLGREAETLSKIEALAIFDEFRSLIPPGSKGDAIVRRLSERLLDLDLVPQAIDLLTYQIQYRLKGLPRAETATQLAILLMSAGQPQEALMVLRQTRLASMPEELRRARLYAEARSLTELGRTDTALEMLGLEQGGDSDRLRGDILWRARRFGESAEMFERSLGTRWQETVPLEEVEQAAALRAAIGYALASDKLGAERLAERFTSKMIGTADGDLFRLLVQNQAVGLDQARKIINAPAMDSFLSAYAKRFSGQELGKAKGKT